MNKYYVLFVLSTIMFGSNGIIAAHINLSSYEIVLTRTLLGSIALLTVMAFKKYKIIFRGKGKDWAFLVGSSLAMGFNWLFLYEAFNYIGVSLAMLACYCGPVLVILASPVLFHERITLVKITGLLAVVVGMVLVNGADVQANGFSWGLFCGIMSGVSFAVMIILNKKASGISGLENSTCQLLVATIMVGIFTLSNHTGPLLLDMESIVAMFFIGVVNTGLGCYLYFSCMHHMPAQSVSICGYLEPLSALALAAIFLGETLSVQQILGAILVLGGVAFAELFRKAST